MKKLKLANIFLILLMMIWDSYYLVEALTNADYSRIATYIVLYPLLFVPFVLKRLKVKISPALEFVYLVFLFLAQFLGSGVNLYASISWFDLFTHLLSGVFTAFLAILLLIRMKQYEPRHFAFHITYILGIVFLVASLWEFFEFGMDQMTGSNLQHALETGVHDTMEDMLAAFIGAIIFVFVYVIEYLQKKKGIVFTFIEQELKEN